MGAAKEDKELTAMHDAYNALKDLDTKLQSRILEWLAKKLEIPSAIDSPGQNSNGHTAVHQNVQTKPAGGIPPDPKAFMTLKRPQNGMERVTCLAFYLTNYRDTKQFKTIDLTKLNTEASQPKLSNPAYFARDAADTQYLSLAGGGKKQITARGEALVDALPDRTAVDAALTDHPLVGRKGTHKKKLGKKNIKK